jgi:DNA-binding CsgD family transcriptional regulator
VVLQPVAGLPRLFLDAFCARYRLTPREKEVVDLLLGGLATADMASQLGISAHTIRDHLKRVYRKTGTRSRSELLSMLSSARLAPAAPSPASGT